jgi:Transcriptional regulator, AbiEi antitoxin
VHPLLRARADAQLGLFTATDALRAGYGHQEIQRRCRAGSWRRVRRGVYATAADLTAAEGLGRRHRLDCLAVLLTLGRPATAVSSVSAARLWGLPVRRDLEDTVRLTDPEVWRRGHGYRVTRASLGPGEVVRSGPVRLTSAARTLVDCAREWDEEDAVVAMDAALLAQRVTREALLDAAAAACRWPGAATAARAVDLTDGRAESPLESRGRLRIVGAGLPTPELQVEIRAIGGRLVAVVDAWFQEAAVAVEFDGRVKYTDPWRGRSPERVLWEEKRREDELRALGVRVVRIADADLGVRWPAVEGHLRGQLALPGPTVRAFGARPRTRGLQRADRPSP